MKNYVFGFTSASGEFFALGEFGCYGRTLVVVDTDRDAARDAFMDYMDDDVMTAWLAEGAYVQTIDHIDEDHFLIINGEV